MAEGKRGFDLGTLLMVLVLLCILVAGLWMTGKALDSRLDELTLKINTMSEQMENDITKLRNDLRTVISGPATAPSPAEPEEPPAKKKKAR
jgi:predicted PurR-regulated permease PerM